MKPSLRSLAHSVRVLTRCLVAGAVSGLVLAGAVQAQIVVKDDRSRSVRLGAAPQRIVSLLPSLTESVCALGACDRLVGTDQFSNWPAQVVALPKLGGIDDAQVERIIALRPDVVLASRTARIAARLEALGVPVIALESDTHADVQSSLRLLGQVLDAQARADALWARIETEFARARERVPPALTGKRVYFEVDDGLWAAGEPSFIGATLKRLGLNNIAGASLGAFPQLNPEFVIRAQPDLIMLSAKRLRDMRTRPGWSGLRALQRNQVCAFAAADFEVLVRPGPRMGEAAGKIADCLAQVPAVR
jgi:iron complex transport system substrate-binding protein